MVPRHSPLSRTLRHLIAGRRDRAFLPILVLAAIGCEGDGAARSEGETAPAAAAAPRTVAPAARDSAARARQDSINRARPGYVIDSVMPVEEELRRFRADLGDPPAGFSHGAPSRSALVAAFVQALERNDTTALVRLIVNRREFGYLVYPTSPNVRAPYRQSPQLVWLQRAAASNKGIARLLDRLGGRPFGLVGYTCSSPPQREGDNTLWTACVVARRGPDSATATLRLFGPIIERGGQFKFLSLTTDL